LTLDRCTTHIMQLRTSDGVVDCSVRLGYDAASHVQARLRAYPRDGQTNHTSTHVLRKLRRNGAKRASPTWPKPMTKRNMTQQVLTYAPSKTKRNAARTECTTTNLTSWDA
jgi:hypothetical protein